MAAKKSKKVVTESKRPVEVKIPAGQVQVIPGNIGELTIRFLAAINSQLADIKKLLEAKRG